MARPRLGNAPLTPAERQRRRRELLAAKRDAERSHETTGNRDAAGCHETAEVERLTAEVERLNAELAKRDNERCHETTGNRDTADSHETAEVERLTAELDKMTRSRAHWEKQVKGLKAKLKKAEADNWQLANRPSYAFGASSLEVDIWRTLLQLVHPDKNGNSEAALKATSWLLQHKPRGNVEEG